VHPCIGADRRENELKPRIETVRDQVAVKRSARGKEERGKKEKKRKRKKKKERKKWKPERKLRACGERILPSSLPPPLRAAALLFVRARTALEHVIGFQ